MNDLSKIFDFILKRRWLVALVLVGIAFFIFGFAWALTLEEGERKFILKRLREIRKMPGRLIT